MAPWLRYYRGRTRGVPSHIAITHRLFVLIRLHSAGRHWDYFIPSPYSLEESSPLNGV